ncbi:hypothetical protein A3B32_01410 [Candidatus Uhrbacteria bacterium RIFCSPLOWO2_01_FULL_53_9]|uniref:Glycosyltransferase 2-like domain-containing protein n=3 Tax=Candidatus Uhriibacteriota TaxID=1752732 RepID=A0A1F7UYR6_9BACT|nr:MAG: hypothetical protein A3C17_04155 [Candidatus Uhrbacteria bacterium RIFCSPHIGHO2_02_FULL_53_13]OGL82908.1 MAG: hypothetical protein A3B32_01410 [Candidatus Uhrbacteria bacterium RIFCSPLOWO2_01_FULL_53_9]OGL89902.1 MAG: hypothetical protein A3I45_00840 [Candidatus Uhrbacteria bacterium RIFCSPLOWO2_02_FULL_53_10]
MNARMPDIAVIVVVYNKLHPQCLPTLRRVIERTKLKVDVVVVDNASPNLDVAALVTKAYPQAHLIVCRLNRGFGSACNRGAKGFKAGTYFFLNPDTILTDDALFEQLHAFIKRYPKVGIVAPRTHYLDGSLQETCRRFPAWHMPIARRTRLMAPHRGKRYVDEFLMKDFDHEAERMVDWVQGSAIMIDAALFREIGGFDERFFMYFEDVDLCRRCWERGRPVYYLPSGTIAHEYTQGSAKVSGPLAGLVTNRLARAHVQSWLRYLSKWGL